jgi:hypothetical protein
MEPELLAHAPSCRERLLKSFASPNAAQFLPVCRSPGYGAQHASFTKSPVDLGGRSNQKKAEK